MDHPRQPLQRCAQIERNGDDVLAPGQFGDQLGAEIARTAGDEHAFHNHARACSGGRRLQKVASVSPATMCQMPHHAVMTAMPPRPSKKLKIRIRPRPEFWMPHSMDTA